MESKAGHVAPNRPKVPPLIAGGTGSQDGKKKEGVKNGRTSSSNGEVRRKTGAKSQIISNPTARAQGKETKAPGKTVPRHGT